MAPGEDLRRSLRGEDRRVRPEFHVGRDEDEEAGPYPGSDLFLRALSIIPFLIAAALGLIGVVGWVVVMLLGAGSGQPVWRAVRGLSPASLVWESALVLSLGLACLAVIVLASWAAAHGFGEGSGRTFWRVTQGLWGLTMVGIVLLWRAAPHWIVESGFASTDVWFAFAVVAYAVVIAGIRLRRAPRSRWRRT